MKSRILSLGKRISTLRSTLFGGRKYATKPVRCDAHMNELPIPCGPWEIYYKDQQTFYTQCLVGGALWWLFSLATLIYTESLFLNFSPPCEPGPPSEYVEPECEEVK